MAQKLLLLCAAGAMGTLARYGVSSFVHRFTGFAFPWGTAAVNLFGCFLVGLIWAVSENRLNLSPETKMLVLVGFMGAFTTFSAFVLETGQLLRNADYLPALGNIALQNLLGIGLFVVGLALGKNI